MNEYYRERNLSTFKPKLAEENIIPSTIIRKGTEEFIATSILHTNNDTIEYEL